MVLYYWWRDESADEVLWPISTMNMHWFFKGTQMGLLGGLGTGLLVGISRKGATTQSLVHDATRYLKWGGQMGIPYTAVKNVSDNAQVSLDTLKERAYALEMNTWHNRIDTGTLIGAIVGRIALNDPRIWMATWGMSKSQVIPACGTYAGAFAGMALLLPLYFVS
ncbi:unnamed protein product [Amoebophrya sp. A25]|nr:unnamed protein product [Amoebophrya sp. A25]|eukprot:GSA25T00011644001.1